MRRVFALAAPHPLSGAQRGAGLLFGLGRVNFCLRPAEGDLGRPAGAFGVFHTRRPARWKSGKAPSGAPAKGVLDLITQNLHKRPNFICGSTFYFSKIFLFPHDLPVLP